MNYSYIGAILFISQIIYSLNLCPRNMDSLNLRDLNSYSSEGFLTHFYEGAINISPMKIHLEMDENNSDYFSVILSKDLKSFDNNYLMLELVQRKESYLQIKNCLFENQTCSKDVSPIVTNKSSTKISEFDIFIENEEMKIYSKSELIYQDNIDFKKLFGEYVYVQIKTKDDHQNISLKDLTVCHIPKKIRSLDDDELDYLEVETYCLKTSPNYLREGNTEIIPSVKLIPKSKNGNFSSNILNYSNQQLYNLVTLQHSRNAKITWQIALIHDNQLVINLQTEVPGEIYLISRYFKKIDFEKYIIIINKLEIDTERSFAEIDVPEQVAGSVFILKIYPRNKHDSSITFIEPSDLEKLIVTAKLPNDTIVDVEGPYFDQGTNAITLKKTFTLCGEMQISIKYNNSKDISNISCSNCNNIKVNSGDLDLKTSDFNCSEDIEIGEIPSFTMVPKDRFNNIIPIEDIPDGLVIECILDNNETLNVTGRKDQQNNIKEYFTDMETKVGNLTWLISYMGQSVEFIVKIYGKPVIANSIYYLSINSSEEKPITNNTQFDLDINSDFNFAIEIVNKYNFSVDTDSVIVEEAKISGNDMIAINFNIKRNQTYLDFSFTEENKEDFKWLVSNKIYEIKILLSHENETAYFYFYINLTSTNNDEEYGNGPYDVSHSSLEPNLTIHKMVGGEKYTMFLYLRTEHDLLYHRELPQDIKELLNYTLGSEDRTFEFNSEKERLGVYKIELSSTIAMENELSLRFNDTEFAVNLMIQSGWNPDPGNYYIVNYTQTITDDTEPVSVKVRLVDIYGNEFINRKDVIDRKKLYMMIGDEKPIQDITIDSDNQTFILNYYIEKEEDLNIEIKYKNNSNSSIISIGNKLSVKYNIVNVSEPEPLVTKINYKPGKAFIYKNNKVLNFSIGMENKDSQTGTNEAKNIKLGGQFIFYIRDRYYEKGENNTKVAWYSGYLALIDYDYSNSSQKDSINAIYDKTIIDILNEANETSGNISYFSTGNKTDSPYISFVKVDFYENGEIKKKYYPISENYQLSSMNIINDILNTIIPKINPDLYSDDILDQYKDLLKENEGENNKTYRNRILRRLSEITKKNKKPQKKSKVKRTIKYRVLQEDSLDNETIITQTLIPREPDIDIDLRQVNYGSDNSSELLSLKLGDVSSETAKLAGSLDNKNVTTNIDNEGTIKTISKKEQTLFINETDEHQKNYIYSSYRSEDNIFTEDFIDSNNETVIRTDFGYKNISYESDSTTDFLFYFSDDNLNLMEYFGNYEYEEYNESVYEKYVLKQMGENFMEGINSTNYSIISEEETIINDTETTLRNLEENRFPYYGEKPTNHIEVIFDVDVIGLQIQYYTETNSYPDNGQTVTENVLMLGDLVLTLSTDTTYTNNYITTRQINHLGYDFINLINNKIASHKIYEENEMNSVMTELNNNLSNIFTQYNNESFTDEFFEAVKDAKTLYEVYNMVYEDIIKLNQNLTGITEKYINDEIKEFTNLRESMKLSYFNFVNSTIKNLELSKDQYISLIKDIKNSINKTQEEIKTTQIYHDILSFIQESKNDFNNYYTNFVRKINRTMEDYFNVLDKNFTHGDKDSYEISLDNLKKTIEENAKKENIFETNMDVIKQQLNDIIKNRKKFSSKFIPKLLEECKIQLSSEEEEIKKTLKNYYNEIEIESNELIDLINEKLEKIDYYDSIEVYRNNLNFLHSAINKTLFELYENIDNTIFPKLIKIEPQYMIEPNYQGYGNLAKTVDLLKETAINIRNWIVYYKDYKKASGDDANKTDENVYPKYLAEDLVEYNSILYNYLNGGEIIYELMTMVETNFNYENFINNLKMITEYYYNTLYSMNYSSFLEYPQEIIDEINGFLNKSDDLIDYLWEFMHKINNFMIDRYGKLYNMTYDYILDVIQFHKNYILSDLANDSILYRIEGQREILDEWFELTVNETIDFFTHPDYNGDWPDYLDESMNQDICYLRWDSFIYEVEDQFGEDWRTVAFGTFAQNFEQEVNDYFNVTNCTSDCLIEKNSTEKEKYQDNLYIDILNNKLSYTKSFLNNVKNRFNEITENNLNELLYVISSKFMQRDLASDNIYHEIKDENSKIYEKYNKTLFNKIEEAMKIYCFNNSSEIIREYELLLNGTFSDIIYDLTVGQYSKLKEELKKALDNAINPGDKRYGLPMPMDNTQYYFTTYWFGDYLNELRNIFRDGDKIWESFLKSEETVKEYLVNYFIKNITTEIEERNQYVIDLFSELQLKIFEENDFNFKDYLVNKLNENNKAILNKINKINVNYSNLIKRCYSFLIYNARGMDDNLYYIEKDLDNFFFDARDGQTWTYDDRSFYRRGYRCYFYLKELREDLELNEAKYIDQTKYFNYLNYMKKKKYVNESCTFDGKINYENCLYDESDLEEVVYENFTEIFTFCKEVGNLAYEGKFKVYEKPKDFDNIDFINTIRDKIKKAFLNFLYPNRTIVDYIYDKFNLTSINNLKKQDLFSVDFKEFLKFEKQLRVEYNSSLKELLITPSGKLFSNIIENQLKEQISYNLRLFKYLKEDVYIDYFNRYKSDADYYVNVLSKMKNIPSSLKNKLSNLFDTIQEEFDSALLDFRTRKVKYLSNFYQKKYVEIFKEQYLQDILLEYLSGNNRFVKWDFLVYLTGDQSEYRPKISGNDEFIQNVEDEIKKVLLETNFTFNSTNLSENKNGNNTEDPQEKINDILKNLNVTEETETEKEILNSIQNYTKQLKETNNFMFRINDSYLLEYNTSLNNYFDENYLHYLEDEINMFNGNNSRNESMPQFYKILANKTFDLFKAIYSKIDAPFNEYNKIMTEYGNLFVRGLDDFVNKLIDYTIIDGLFYMSSPCEGLAGTNCPSHINISTIEQEIKNNVKNPNVRNLEETELSEAIKDFYKAVKKEKHHIYRYKNYDFIKDSTDLNNKLRKLESYNYQSEPIGENQVFGAIFNLKNTFYEFIEKYFWEIENIKMIKKLCRKSIKKEINKVLKYINNTIDLSFNEAEIEHLEIQYYSIEYFIENRIEGIEEKTGIYLNKLDDLYHYLYIIGEFADEKLRILYKTLHSIIDTKNKNISEIDYEKYTKERPNRFEIIGNPSVYTKIYKTESPNILDSIIPKELYSQSAYEKKIWENIIEKFKKEVQKNQELIKSNLKMNIEMLADIEKYSDEALDEEDNDLFKLEEYYGFFNDVEMSKKVKDILKKRAEEKAKKENEKNNKQDDGDNDKQDGDDNNKKDSADNNKDEASSKKDESLVDKLEKVNFKVSSTMRFSFQNWTIYFKIDLDIGIDLKKEVPNLEWEIPIVFPVFPLFQMRLGFKIMLGISLKIGFVFTFERDQKNGFEFNVHNYIQISIYAKIMAKAEAGIYFDLKAVKACVAGGVEGTLINGDIGVILNTYPTKLFEKEIYFYVKIGVMTFRAYCEARETVIGLFEISQIIWDKTFSFPEKPLLNLGMYYRFTCFGVLLEEREINEHIIMKIKK